MQILIIVCMIGKGQFLWKLVNILGGSFNESN